MGWLERVKRNTWVDIYADFDDKGNDVRHVRVRPDDLDRLIAIAELDGRDCCCPGLRRKISYAKDDYESHTHLIICPYHEDWKP